MIKSIYIPQHLQMKIRDLHSICDSLPFLFLLLLCFKSYHYPTKPFPPFSSSFLSSISRLPVPPSRQPQRIIPGLFLPADGSTLLLLFLRFFVIQIPRPNPRRFPVRTTAFQQSSDERFHQAPDGFADNAKTFSKRFADRRESGLDFVAERVTVRAKEDA